MSSAVIRRMNDLDVVRERAQIQRVLRSALVAHMDGHARQFRDLAAYYGDNLPYSTGPESAARALFEFGVDAGILTEHNRPDFVRKWGGAA